MVECTEYEKIYKNMRTYVILIFICMIFSVHVSAKTLKVPVECDTVQRACDEAKDGDTIIVCESVKLPDTLKIGKSITLKSDDSLEDKVVMETERIPVLIISGRTVAIEGIDFLCHCDCDSGVIINGGETTFDSCKFTSPIGACIRIEGKGSRVTANDCSIEGSSHAGVIAHEAVNASFQNCSFSGNEIGLQITESAQVALTRCKFYSNPATGIIVRKNGLVSVVECEINDTSCFCMAREGSIARLYQCHFENKSRYYYDEKFPSVGVYADSEAKITMKDCSVAGPLDIIANVPLRTCDGANAGMFSLDGAEIDAENCSVRNWCYGCFAADAGTLNLRGSRIEDNVAGIVATDGGVCKVDITELRSNLSGILTINHGRVDADDCLLEKNTCFGVFALETGQGRFHRNQFKDNGSQALLLRYQWQNVTSKNAMRNSGTGDERKTTASQHGIRDIFDSFYIPLSSPKECQDDRDVTNSANLEFTQMPQFSFPQFFSWQADADSFGIILKSNDPVSIPVFYGDWYIHETAGEIIREGNSPND